MERSQAGFTLETEAPVVVNNLPEEDRFDGPDLLTNHGVQSGISVIIGSPDRPHGILGTHGTARKEFSQEDVVFEQSVANILGNRVGRDKRERTLQTRTREIEGVLDSLDAAVWVRDTEDRFRLVNQTYRNLVGVNDEDFIGAPIEDVIQDPEAARFRAIDEQVIASGEAIEERVTIETDRGKRHLRLVSYPPPMGRWRHLCRVWDGVGHHEHVSTLPGSREPTRGSIKTR